MSDLSHALPPHPLLSGYYRTSGAKRGFLGTIFDRAANDYDRIENLMSLGTGRWYRRQALIRAGLMPGMRVLDVAVGTGLVAREEIGLIGAGGSILGIDPSPAMMRQAVASLGIRAILGLGEQLPLADRQFDFLSMGYALRHLNDIGIAFSEFFRVLRPGGRICILEISRPRSAVLRALLRAYLRYGVPTLARFATRGGDSKLLWRYYWDTIEACVTPQAVTDCLKICGFTDIKTRCELGMFTEYTAMRPTIQ